MTRTPPRPGAPDLKLVHPVANDSEAGRAPGRAAAGTSGHAQQHARPAAAMPHACWRPEPGRTVAASKLTCRVTGPRTTGTRKDGSASGPRDRIRTFIKEAYCPTIGAAVHSQPRAGLQPGRPPFRIFTRRWRARQTARELRLFRKQVLGMAWFDGVFSHPPTHRCSKLSTKRTD